MNSPGRTGLNRMGDHDSPQLSIIVAFLQETSELKKLLGALYPQSGGRKVEIIVAHGCLDGEIDEVKKDYPQVLWVHPSGGTTLPDLWGAAIARSSGEVIAITESACIPDDDWISSILEAHKSPHPVVGGAVETGGLRRWVDWAAYFCEYGQFMLPLQEGVTQELPGNNFSFKRVALKKRREFVQEGFWKTYWCRELQKEGIQLRAQPSIIVSWKKSYRLIPFLIRRFHHGRCFAGMRLAQSSLGRRVCYILGSPLLPILFLRRIFQAILPKKRYRKEFIFSLPISFLAILLWSIGEFWGYITGKGKSCAFIY